MINELKKEHALNDKRKMTKKTDIRARESFTDSVLNSTVYLRKWFLNHTLEVEKEVDKELAVFLLKHEHSNA